MGRMWRPQVLWDKVSGLFGLLCTRVENSHGVSSTWPNKASSECWFWATLLWGLEATSRNFHTISVFVAGSKEWLSMTMARLMFPFNPQFPQHLHTVGIWVPSDNCQSLVTDLIETA